MEGTERLVQLLREAESILITEGNDIAANWIAGVCDSISLGELEAIEEFKNNLNGMGGFWEASNSKRFQSVIVRIGGVLDEIAF